MPVGGQYDFQLGGNGYMLVRTAPYQGRAWQRTGQPDTPSRRSETDAKYGVVDDTLDHPEVWDDWSGGFGQSYRRAGENTYHWAENFDARFPRQLVHAQELRMIGSVAASFWSGGLQIFDRSVWSLPDPAGGSVDHREPQAVQIFTLVSVASGDHVTNGIVVLQPTGLRTEGSAFTKVNQGTIATYNIGHGKGAVFAGGYFSPVAFGSASYGSGTFISWNLIANTGGNANPPNPASGFAVAGNALWKYFGLPTARNLVNSVPANDGFDQPGDWSATLTVGDGTAPILDMISHEDQLFCGMPNGLYVGDASGSFSNVLQDLAGQTTRENCRDLTVHQGQVMAGAQGAIYAYAPYGDRAMVRQILEPNLGNRSPIQGMVRSLRSFGGWLYAGMWSGSASYLLAGQDTVGNGQYKWHTLQRLPAIFKPHRIHFDSISTASGGKEIPNRVWVLTDGSQGAGAPIYYHPVPRANGNPLMSDPTFSPSYMGSARLDLGIVDWNAPSTPKLFRAVDIWAENLASAAQWCDVYYTIDGAARTKLGTTAKSPKDTLYFPTGDSARTVNMCTNSTFEGGTTDWTLQNVTMAQSSDQAHGGTKSLKLTGDGGGSDDACAVNVATGWVPGQTFTVTAWIYVPTLFAPGDTRGLTIGIYDFVNGVADNTHSAQASVAGAWQQLTVSRLIRQGTSAVNVRLYLGDRTITSICYWDDVLYTAPTTGQSIALSLESFTASYGVTPIYRAVVLRGTLRPRSIDEISAVVRIADDLVDRQGTPLRPGATMLQELRDLATAAAPTTLVDLAGATQQVVVLAPVEESEIYQSGETDPEIVAKVRLAVLTFSG